MNTLDRVKDWRGYVVWAACLILLLVGAIDGAEFAAITGAVAIQKGAEGYARVKTRAAQ